jgi:hypothetical protein
MKIPPRITFIAQFAAAILGAVCQIAISEWMYLNIPNMCDASTKAVNPFFCPAAQTFGTSSVGLYFFSSHLLSSSLSPETSMAHPVDVWPLFTGHLGPDRSGGSRRSVLGHLLRLARWRSPPRTLLLPRQTLYDLVQIHQHPHATQCRRCTFSLVRGSSYGSSRC